MKIIMVLNLSGCDNEASTDNNNIISNSAMKSNLINNNGDYIFTKFFPNKDRETIILLHGGPGLPDDFQAAVDILKSNYQVITFHQRGTKQSPVKTRNYTIEAYLSDIEVIRKHYGIEKFHLWGHSWGGLYAQIYAEKYPENLLSLFLCNPGSGTNNEWKQTEKEVLQFNKSKCSNWEWTKMGMNSLWGMLGSDTAYKKLYIQVKRNYLNSCIEI